jgi:pimeloyl-ACP methyl ester carboxylesterase
VDVKERVVTFGPERSMVGIVTEPAKPSRAPQLIVLDAGFVHRVGPGRIGVQLARQAAESGFSVLRFDQTGIGDTPPRIPPLDPIACGIADAREAMDHLSDAHGTSRFVLLGLCSGARHAHHIAVADKRVAGCVMLDGYAFATARSRLMEAGERLAKPMALLAGAKRRVLRRLSDAPPPVVREDEAFFPRDPTLDEMSRDLRVLASRGVNLLYVYSGEWRKYRYPGQLRDAFGEVALDPILSEHLIPTADHLYSTKPERAEMLGLVKSWLGRKFS